MKGFFNMNDLYKVPRTCCVGSKVGGPFQIGNHAHINSGSPLLTVVDINPNQITVAWKDQRGEVYECELPPQCLHHAR